MLSLTKKGLEVNKFIVFLLYGFSSASISFTWICCVEEMNEHISMSLLCSVLNHMYKPDLFMISSCISMMSDYCFSSVETSVMIFSPVSWLVLTNLNLFERKLAGEFAKQTCTWPDLNQYLLFCLISQNHQGLPCPQWLPRTLQGHITHICVPLCVGSQTSHRNASNGEGSMLGVTRHVSAAPSLLHMP